MISRLLFLADLHAGSKTGFLPRGYRDVETGATYSLGASQEVIWKEFKAIEKKAFKGCDELILVLMGDLVHGPATDYPGEVNTPDVKTQAEMVIHALLPIANKAKSLYSIDALSRYHVDAGRFSDDFIANELGAFGKRSHVKLDIVVQDVHLQLRHHGPSLGHRAGTRGDPVRRFMKDAHFDALEIGEQTPDVWVFGMGVRALAYAPLGTAEGDRAKGGQTLRDLLLPRPDLPRQAHPEFREAHRDGGCRRRCPRCRR
jgi:hypothetical protein